jgi:hypothetical protein
LPPHRPARPRLPTPDEIARAPELAILAAIEHALDVAIVTLVAAQPELRPSHDGYDAVISDAAYCADTVIIEAQTLVRAIAAYRAVVLAEHVDR